MEDIWLENFLKILNQLDSLTCPVQMLSLLFPCPSTYIFLFCRLLCSNIKQDSAGNSLPGKVDCPSIVDWFKNCILYAIVQEQGIAFSVSAAGFITIKRVTSNAQLGRLMCREPSSVCVQTGQHGTLLWLICSPVPRLRGDSVFQLHLTSWHGHTRW